MLLYTIRQMKNLKEDGEIVIFLCIKLQILQKYFSTTLKNLLLVFQESANILVYFLFSAIVFHLFGFYPKVF